MSTLQLLIDWLLVTLKTVGIVLSKWARQGRSRPVGRFRTVLNSVALALVWSARGEHDTRTFVQRMRAGSYYWRSAYRSLVS